MGICTFGAICGELLSARVGGDIPLVAITTFYFVVLLGWRRPLFCGLGAAVLLDLFLMRSVPITVLLVPMAAVLALFWRRHGDCKTPGVQALPGAILGGATGTAVVLCLIVPFESFTWAFVLHCAWVWGSTLLLGVISAPLWIAALDHSAARLELPCFRDIQEHLDPSRHN
ncbi:MAG: hypothetical protein HN742_05110 [Lentisphaerae bacterium]|nr:hypothetical protein [Lentisphaerota bacterium]MBT4823123.1 hypothetical protein [Lentisphaerota bacterium]MBT5610803.1 hypothetical protein [Lentisphaerota bacterium]MBT7053765.1 hypothetical protein [Lentisphaerota bacterium]MBT7841226.1 hypothetical protein [Lentisphaerota bacterium]